MSDAICTYCGQEGHRASHCPRRSIKIVRTVKRSDGVVVRKHVSAARTVFTTWDGSLEPIVCPRVMPKRPNPMRAQCEEYLRAGATRKAVALAFGVAPSTVAMWAKAMA